MTEKNPLIDPAITQSFAQAGRDSKSSISPDTDNSSETTELAALAQEVFRTLNQSVEQERFLFAEIITQSKLGGDNSAKSIHTMPPVPEDGEFIIGKDVTFPSFWIMQERTRPMNLYIPGFDDERIGTDEEVRTTLMLNPAKDVQPMPLLDMIGKKRPGVETQLQSFTAYTPKDKIPQPTQMELLWQGLAIAAGIHDYFEQDTGSHAMEMNGVPGHALIIRDEHKPFMNIERFVPHEPAA